MITCYCVNHGKKLGFQKCIGKSYISERPIPCMGYVFENYIILDYGDEVYSWEPNRRKDFIVVERFLKINIEEGMHI